MLLMKMGHVVDVKLLDKPPSKGLGSELDEVVAVAVEDVAEADVVAWLELSWLELSELDSSLWVVVPVAVAVDLGIVISNVVVTVLLATAALLRSSFSSGSNIVHLPSSRKAGT